MKIVFATVTILYAILFGADTTLLAVAEKGLIELSDRQAVLLLILWIPCLAVSIWSGVLTCRR